MGLDQHAVRFLLMARSEGVSFDRVLTIGRQSLRLTAKELQKCFRQQGAEMAMPEIQQMLTSSGGYAEPLLRHLGAVEISSLDASAYEGATTIHDLNCPIPENLKNRFTLVIDGGSLEHIFNAPSALKNCLEMVAEAGHFIASSPANNWFGHGFYQFSPEWFHRVLVPANGYEVQKVIVCETPSKARWYEVIDPSVVQRRSELVNFRQTSLLVLAKRTRVVPVLSQIPQQSDYESTWRNPGLVSGRGNLQRSPLRLCLGGLTRYLGPLYRKWVRRWLCMFFPYWAAPESFRKIDLNTRSLSIRHQPAMRQILIVVPTYEPFKDGLAEAAKVTAEGLAKRGYGVTVATSYHPDRHSEVTGSGVTVRQFKVTGNSSLRVGIHGEVAAYQEFVASFRGDFIICHSWGTWTTDLAIAAFSKTPAREILVSHGYTAHLLYWHSRFPWGLGQWLGWEPYVARLPFMLRKFSRVVLLSERADRQRFFDHWVAKLTGYKGIIVIPNGVDPGAFDKPLPNFRAKFGLGEGLVFLCVANYCTRKNQELAVRAFRKARLLGATLVFIGSEFNEYQAMVRDLDQELARLYPEGRVLFLEKVDREMTLAAFKACDVFVLSSEYETQPIVLMEAMACAKPFISTESSGCIAELPGGLVVRSEQEMSEKMKYLSENPAAGKALGVAGRSACQARYTHERVVDAYQKLLESLDSR